MMVLDENFEISTYRLQGDCSASELIQPMGRYMGTDPISPASQTDTLPLC